MEKNKKKYYYHNNQNNRRYYPKKKKKREDIMEKEKMTYEKLINKEIADEIIDYPKESNDSMMKFVAISIVVMAIVLGSLLLFRLI